MNTLDKGKLLAYLELRRTGLQDYIEIIKKKKTGGFGCNPRV